MHSPALTQPYEEPAKESKHFRLAYSPLLYCEHYVLDLAKVSPPENPTTSQGNMVGAKKTVFTLMKSGCYA